MGPWGLALDISGIAWSRLLVDAERSRRVTMDMVVLVLQSWRGPRENSAMLTVPCKTGLNRSGAFSRLQLGKLLFPYCTSVIGLFAFVSSSDVVKLGESNITNKVTTEPEFKDPGYRALIEEDVKESVSNIANDPVMQTVRLFFILAADHQYLALLALGCF